MDSSAFESDMRLRTVPRLLEYAARTHGERSFLRESGSAEWLSFAGALRSAQGLAGALAALGIGSGDYVPVMLPNGLPFALTWFALNLRGAAYLGVNTSLVGSLLGNQLALGRSRVWVVDAEYLPALDDLPNGLRDGVEVLVVAGLPAGAEPGARTGTWTRIVRLEALMSAVEASTSAVHFLDVCTVGFTSGTTGPSKGVMVPHGQAVTSGLGFARAVELGADDVLFSPLPMFHGMSTRMGMLPALLTGCRMVIGKRFSGTRFWAEAIEAEATVAQIIFSIPGILLAQPPGPQDRSHRVTRMFNAHHNAAFRERFGVEFIEAFAMSEIGIVSTSTVGELRPGSAGRVLPDWEVAVVDEDGLPVPDGAAGEILCRPRKPGLMMRGYLHQPDRAIEVTRDLWFHSGDVGRLDADGYLWFLDRAKERIRRRGENISSLEIEEAVRRHPGIRDAAALAYPARAGEDDIRLLVVPREDCIVVASELHGWMRGCLPRFMVARYIEVVHALPYTATNKIEKARLIAAGLGPGAWDAEGAP